MSSFFLKKADKSAESYPRQKDVCLGIKCRSVFPYWCSETTDIQNNKLLLLTTEKVVTVLLSLLFVYNTTQSGRCREGGRQ